jgi:hypothetical protein
MPSQQPIEFELRFVFSTAKAVNDTRRKLRDLGFRRAHAFSTYRVAYFCLPGHADMASGFVRVREEGASGVTLTVKRIPQHKNGYAEEREQRFDARATFDDACSLVESMGVRRTTESIKLRERWVAPSSAHDSQSKGVHEIVIDVWPGLPPLMEIDCHSEPSLHRTARLLGLDVADGFPGSAYERVYGIPRKAMAGVSRIDFGNYASVLSRLTSRPIDQSTLSQTYKAVLPKRLHAVAKVL